MAQISLHQAPRWQEQAALLPSLPLNPQHTTAFAQPDSPSLKINCRPKLPTNPTSSQPYILQTLFNYPQLDRLMCLLMHETKHGVGITAQNGTSNT